MTHEKALQDLDFKLTFEKEQEIRNLKNQYEN